MPSSTPPSSPTLAELAAALGHLGAELTDPSMAARVVVRDLRQDSREVRPGDLFAARSGVATSGIAFVGDAIGHGACAVMVERGANIESVGVPVLSVTSIRSAIGLAAEVVHGYPSRTLGGVAITGTNGKTTTAWLVERAIRGSGGQAARLGTVGFALGDETWESCLTTPEPDMVSRFLARAREAGATHFVMEASSHALAQGRIDALRLRVAAFSNLTQDHLDFHGNMGEYAGKKARLFTELDPLSSVINVDDGFGRELASRARGRVSRVSRHPGADVFPEWFTADAAGTRARVVLPSGSVEFSSPLVGTHNLDNLLLALGIVDALGLDAGRAAQALADAPPVPGRLERCDGPADDVVVLVDYAHTPDALQRALAAVRGLTTGSLRCVFGCGGDRDPTKRASMGDAVGRGADFAIVTNDNPRTEDPRRIADAIEPGLRPHGIPYEVVLDRALAIERAVVGAASGDVILIAGKGHEPYQIFGTVKRPFDDRDEGRRALALRRAARTT
ncbi:MAG: UDP-N-acetylmuramoyl-L-alanyl-D-glutamate--2,6-diaminopimelate ligase [Polyangiaceae bacterium]|nr:UDP-N-acetylmuramoyl-L-alanyl-D-glutamate--2,6-diaminopimelate ligase [Polyangiaceae bacterium]